MTIFATRKPVLFLFLLTASAHANNNGSAQSAPVAPLVSVVGNTTTASPMPQLTSPVPPVDPMLVVRQAVFRLKTQLTNATAEAGHGTAFVVRADGLLATNYHVVIRALLSNGDYGLILETPEGNISANVVAIDAVNDLALVKVERVFPIVLGFAPQESLSAGIGIHAFGFPLTQQLTVTQGIYNGEKLLGFAPVALASIALNPGMSGGPIVNAQGQLVAINRAIAKEAQSVSFLSPARALMKLLERSTTDRAPASSVNWMDNAAQGIIEQEKAFLAQSVAKSARLGKVEFALPFAEMQCSQDRPKNLLDGFLKGSVPLEIMHCEGNSMALADDDVTALEVSTVALQSSNFALLRNMETQIFSRFLAAQKKSAQRAPADSAKKERQQPAMSCGVRNVKGGTLSTITARYCSYPTAPGSPLYSTMLKLDLGKDSNIHLYEIFQGVSLEATASLVERFLASVKQEEGTP